jgi:hypothetical protein
VNGYRTGRVNTGGLGLASTPIIDLRGYTDLPTGDIHTRVHSFVMRQRLLDANGTYGNHVMLVANAAGGGFAQLEALTQMEAWLNAIRADNAPGKASERVIRNRPVALTDACWAGSTKIAEPFGILGGGTCAGLYPTFAETRTIAGSPLASDVFKCRLQRLDFDDYDVSFTAEQQARLGAAFPTGVCDWRKKGVSQNDPKGPWLDYGG